MMRAVYSPVSSRLSVWALIRLCWRSLMIRAPTTRISRPRKFRTMIVRPSREIGRVKRQRRGSGGTRGRLDFAVSVTDAIEGFDGVELRIDLPELLAHALDVAVDGAVIDVDL